MEQRDNSGIDIRRVCLVKTSEGIKVSIPEIATAKYIGEAIAGKRDPCGKGKGRQTEKGESHKVGPRCPAEWRGQSDT
jgi:hypothetical protein